MSSNNSPANCNSTNFEQPNFSSILEVSDGKGRPVLRRLVLTPTHLIIQRNIKGVETTDNDADSNRPTHKREVSLVRVDGTLGLSVRGGAEHELPLIISRLSPGSPAALCKQIFIGDAILAINGVKITRMDHDSAVEYLNGSGPTVTLKLKYYPTAKPFLSPTQQNLLESNLGGWEGGMEVDSDAWEQERSIPLLLALLTRYLGGSDRLRCNAFEVRDSTGNASSGIVHCGDAFTLTSWTKCIADAILGLNNIQMKLWTQETSSEIYYVGWVWEGNDEASGELQPWLIWKPKVLAFRGLDLYYMDYPPGVGSDWDGAGECHPMVTTLLRVLQAGEHLDERQHCFTLQIATENPSFPPNGSRAQPITFYLNTETRQELIKVETAWTKAVTSAVKAIKKCSYSVWWGGKPCQLELDFPGATFNLYRSSSKPSPPLWSRAFASLKGSSDDARTRLTLKFHGELPQETMECRDLHRVLFTIHSFLLAKVVH